MGKKIDYKFEKQKFKSAEIKTALYGIEPMKGYHLNKKDNEALFNQVTQLISQKYSQKKEVQFADIIYSGDTAGNVVLSIICGRIDDDLSGKPTCDIDVYNIAPDTDSTNTYFSSQFFHYKQEDGSRLTFNFSGTPLTSLDDRITELYNSYIIPPFSAATFEVYESSREDLFQAFKDSFGFLNKIK